MSKNTGGPAFPTTNPLGVYGDPNVGMSLRDWFAGMAMQGLVSSPRSIPRATMAEHAYLMADAMIAEREK